MRTRSKVQLDRRSQSAVTHQHSRASKRTALFFQSSLLDLDLLHTSNDPLF